MVPPALSYRARLRTEGLALAICGVAGSAVLLAVDERTRLHVGSTVGQLAVVTALLAALGPRSARSAIAGSKPAGERAATGEPTPLWHLPLVVTGLSAPLVALGAWDAGLRVTAGCVLVGLSQALLLARVVHADEQATHRMYVRAPGSRLLRGTKLAYVPAPDDS